GRTFVSNSADDVAQLVGVKIGQTTGTRIDRLCSGYRLLRRVGDRPDIVAADVPRSAGYLPHRVLDLPAVKTDGGARFSDQRDAMDPPLGVHRHGAFENAEGARAKANDGDGVVFDLDIRVVEIAPVAEYLLRRPHVPQ